MTEEESLLAAIYEDVKLCPYDPSWPVIFNVERERLLNLFPAEFIDVQHIGSTAVPELLAKPIIDILAGVRSIAVADSLSTPLCRSGYTTSSEFNATLTERRWFMRWAGGHRTHHLHVVVHGGREWHRHLRFRDALRTDQQLAARYSQLKSELAHAYVGDREAYTNAKTEFISAIEGDA